MSFQQIVSPNPNIECRPGWCLQYVRQTFGAPAVEPTATAGWANAKYRHEDWNFPEGVAVPVWFKLATEPAGHVALRMADGSVYSTSDDSNVPHHHPDMQDLIRYYWRNPLTYMGWSEDISGVRVVQEFSINFQSESITPVQEDDMGYVDDLSDDAAAKIARHVHDLQVDREGGGTNTLRWSLSAEAQRTEGIISRTAEATARLILNAAITRGGGSVGGETSLAGVVAYFDQNRADILNAVGGAVKDVPGLDPAQVNAAIKAGLDAALTGTQATITLGGSK